MKTITMSVRVSQADADFIASLQLPNASTPSDKLRAIIADARRRHHHAHSFPHALRDAQQMLEPGRTNLRDLEHRHRVHSDLVALLGDWLPEVAAMISTFPTPAARPARKAADTQTPRQLADLERHLADKLFALIEAALRLGVTPQCRCYDPRVIADRLEPTLQITRLIHAASPTRENES